MTGTGGSACPIILRARVFWFVYLSVLLGMHASRFKAHVTAEWQVESLWGSCDGQSSYLWFKDWRGSELRRFSSEGNIKAAFRFVLPACFALSFIFFFLYGNTSLPWEFRQRHYLPCKDQRSPPQANNSCFPWRCTPPLWPDRHLLGLISRRSQVVFKNQTKLSKQ